MKKIKSRTSAASLNAFTMLVTQVIGLLLKFGVQTIFIRELSQAYLGINGVFVNVISFLSFADLGIGTAITVALYKPIAENDEGMMRALVHLYKRAYEVIIVLMIVIGLAISPFIHLFIKDSPFTNGQIALWFLIYMVSTIASYFSAYKRSFVMATQRGYIDSINTFVFKSIQQILQIIIIWKFHSFLGFLLVQAFATVASNIQFSHTAAKLYPNIFKTEKAYSLKKIDKSELKKIKNNVVGAISAKIGGLIVFSSDNILISAFLGLIAVAQYSNYTLILTSVNGICNQILGSFVSSIGNLNVTSSPEHQEDVIHRLQYVSALINLFITVGFSFGLNIFINIWAGKAYVLPIYVTILMVLNNIVGQSRILLTNFISGMGLYWPLRWKSLIEAGANLILSILFLAVFKLGISGIILATLSSNIVINLLWEPYIVFHLGLHRSMKKYLTRFFSYQLFTWITAILLSFLSTKFANINILSLIMLLVACEIVFIGLFLIMTASFNEADYFRKKVIRRLR